MKFLLTVFTFFSVCYLTAQQNSTINEDKVYRFVQKKAEPEIGLSNFSSAFANEFNSLVVPPKSDEISFKLKFIIEKNGTLSNIEIKENEQAYTYINEVTRVLSTISTWNPAEIKGKKVRSFYVMPIKLRFPMRNVDKALLEKSILERTISNQYFEFECNCKLLNNSTNRYGEVKEFSYNTSDNNVFYSITLKEIILHSEQHYFNIIKVDAEKQNATISEVDYKNYEALESNFAIHTQENTYYNNTLYFVAGKYLINITVISANEQISKFNFADLKQTFKLKIDIL